MEKQVCYAEGNAQISRGAVVLVELAVVLVELAVVLVELAVVLVVGLAVVLVGEFDRGSTIARIASGFFGSTGDMHILGPWTTRCRDAKFIIGSASTSRSSSDPIPEGKFIVDARSRSSSTPEEAETKFIATALGKNFR